MRYSRFLALLAAASLATVTLTAKADNLVTNPTFDGGSTAYPGYGVIPGWTSPDTFVYSGDPGATGSGSAANTPFDTPGLPNLTGNAGFIQAYTGSGGPLTNQLTQTLATVAGVTYGVSFDVGARNCCNGTANIFFSIGDDFAYISSVSSSGWLLVTGEFTATAADEFLTIENVTTGGNDSTLLVTNVNVDTPEPSSLLLLGTGLVGLAGAVRRKVRK